MRDEYLNAVPCDFLVYGCVTGLAGDLKTGTNNSNSFQVSHTSNSHTCSRVSSIRIQDLKTLELIMAKKIGKRQTDRQF
jgi:hypothetical protein